VSISFTSVSQACDFIKKGNRVKIVHQARRETLSIRIGGGIDAIDDVALDSVDGLLDGCG
jgi:hypothetical protein